MVETLPCPEVGVIQRFLLGQIPEGDASSLADHLSQCGTCLNSAISLSSPDVVTELIQSKSRSERSGSPRSSAREPDEATVPARRSPRGWDDEHFLLPPQQPDEIGRLGPYRVLRLLGEGGMGFVYLAEDPHLARLVALKVMKPSAASADAARKRFLREARAAAAIEHDHIVTIYQVGEDCGVPYLAMQSLQGETLHDRLRAEPRLPVREVLRIGRQVAEGLAAAHEGGLIHRDVKPSNIWLEAGRNRIKILDFGLARQATGTDVELSHSGFILGTPAYMAPEQAGGASLDFRCDLFSLGSVIYRMCAGVVPFKGANSIAILQALALETPRPLNEVNPQVPPALAALVARLLSKEPEGRPNSAHEVVEALQAIERMPLPQPSGGGMSFLDSLESAQLEPLEPEITPRPNVGKSAGPVAGQSRVSKPQDPGASRSETTPPPGASRTGKSPGPGGSGKQRRPSASSTVKSPAASGTQTTKSPDASGSGSARTPKASEPKPPAPTSWDDMPVLPSRSKTMRRHYRRQNEEWVPLAVGTAVVTALIIGVVAIVRQLFVR